MLTGSLNSWAMEQKGQKAMVQRHLILDRIDRLIFERSVFGGPGSGIAIACQSPEMRGSLGVWGLVTASGSGVAGGGGGAGLKD